MMAIAMPCTKPVHRAPSHTARAFDIRTMRSLVKQISAKVKELKADAIAACGHSGLPIAGAVSYVTNIPVFAVRKQWENPRAAFSGPVSAVAHNGPAQRWVFLDDFLSTGKTFRGVCEQLYVAGVVAEPLPIATLEYQTPASYRTGYNIDEDIFKIDRNDYDAWAKYPRNHTIPCFGFGDEPQPLPF